MENSVNLVSMSEIAKKLHTKRSVVKTWSKAFGIKATKSENGEKFYTTQDLEAFTKIKQSFTDKKDNSILNACESQIMPALTEQAQIETLQILPNDLVEKISKLKNQLNTLKSILD